MRALITGINGFVGSYLAEHLLANGSWELWGVGRGETLALAPPSERVRYIAADLCNSDATRDVLEHTQPDVIFHLAGQANVHRSFREPSATLQNNTQPALNVFQAITDLRGTPTVVIVGSNEIYGQVRPEELPLDETTPLRPVSPYAVSKACQDLLAYQYYVSNQIRTVRLRPFNHIGPRQTSQYVASAFAAQIAEIEAGRQEPVLRVGNLAAERDFTDVRDMVRAYELAALRGAPGDVYNIGSGRTESVQWLLDTLVSLSKLPITVETDPARMRPADIPRVESDSRRFCQQTGWEPRIPLEQTIYDILEFWRQQAARTQ